ncbi:hypothetical protein BD626DRAFT_537029 [Schizophyllum amplum]|uniref:Uncharacterized protein n=1 Tax=Schizophyllum amplum TaxID=97359 RepID=A0A550CFY6_9AGAR|nr:hypothetical protein BD626DRAFT_537029 [Auriculariopsis ampla]
MDGITKASAAALKASASALDYAKKITAATTVSALILTPLLGPPILGAVGFQAGGVLAGSAAAGMQAGIGNVVAGSIFAGAQAAGATGMIPAVGLVVGGAVGGATTYVGKKADDFRRSDTGAALSAGMGMVAACIGKKAKDLVAGKGADTKRL